MFNSGVMRASSPKKLDISAVIMRFLGFFGDLLDAMPLGMQKTNRPQM